MTTNPPAINAPKIVVWMIAIMVGLHLLREVLPASTDSAILRYFAFIPARFTDIGYSHLGGLPASLWGWLSYNFLHGDFTHLLVNCMWMLAFGSAVAWRVGPKRFLIFSLVCGACGALLHLVFHWAEPYPVIGASAMISGHMAAAIRFIFRQNGAFGMLGKMHSLQQPVPLATVTEVFQDRRSLVFVAVWAGINLLVGLGAASFGSGSTVAWEAHIGGFVAGLLLFGYFDPPPPPPKSYYHVV